MDSPPSLFHDAIVLLNTSSKRRRSSLSTHTHYQTSKAYKATHEPHLLNTRQGQKNKKKSPPPQTKMVTTRAAATRASPAAPSPSPSPAGGALEIDPVSKARTIAHMNADHRADLSAILRRFAGLSEADAADPELVDIDLAALSVRSASGAHAVPLVPPMAAWADRRARLVDMTTEARRALGIEAAAHAQHAPSSSSSSPGGAGSDSPAAPRVAFYPPQGVGVVSFTGVSLYFVSAAFYFSGNLVPGSAFWRLIEAVHFPGGPEFYTWLVRMILLPVLGIHFFEAFYLMGVKRLPPRGVPIGSAMWCLWVGCTFLEGLPAWQRFDQKVLGKQKRQ